MECEYLIKISLSQDIINSRWGQSIEFKHQIQDEMLFCMLLLGSVENQEIIFLFEIKLLRVGAGELIQILFFNQIEGFVNAVNIYSDSLTTFQYLDESADKTVFSVGTVENREIQVTLADCVLPFFNLTPEE